MNYGRKHFGISTITLALVANLVTLPQSDSFTFLASKKQCTQTRHQQLDFSKFILESSQDHHSVVTKTTISDTEFSTSINATSPFSKQYDPSDELIPLLEKGEALHHHACARSDGAPHRAGLPGRRFLLTTHHSARTGCHLRPSTHR